MNFDIREEVAWLQGLGTGDRARFLADLSHNITIAIRVLCHSSGSADRVVECVRILNEAHHRVASYLSHHHMGDEDASWIPAVVGYVFNSKDPVVLQQVEQAWHYSRSSMSGGNG